MVATLKGLGGGGGGLSPLVPWDIANVLLEAGRRVW